MFNKFSKSAVLFVVLLLAIGMIAPYGAAQEPYNITMAFLATSNVPDLALVQAEINKIALEKIGATVTLMPISPAAWLQQTNLMLTSGEKLDLIVTSSDFGYDVQASKGQLVALDELLEEYGQGVLAAVPEDVLAGTKVAGKIYGVPSVRDWARQYGYYMRKDLVEKYDIDLAKIETFHDLTPIFQTIKDEEGIYPIANTNAPVAEILVGEYFDVLGDRFGVVHMNGDGTVVNMFEEPEYKEILAVVRDWYEKGFIMKDAPITQDSAIAVMKAGKGAGAFSILKPGFEVQEATYIGREMVAVNLTPSYMYTVRSWMLSVARNSKNPVKAMEFMNLLYTDADIMNLIAIGIEGKHYVLNEDGLAKLPEGVTESGYFQSQWQIGNNFLTHVWEGNPADLWEQTREFNDSAIPSPVVGFAFDPDRVKTQIAAVTNVAEQYRKGLEHGVLDPEKSLPEFVKQLKSAGLDRIIAEKQRQIDEWKAIQ